MVYGTGLENRQPPKGARGFESLPLRSTSHPEFPDETKAFTTNVVSVVVAWAHATEPGEDQHADPWPPETHWKQRDGRGDEQDVEAEHGSRGGHRLRRDGARTLPEQQPVRGREGGEHRHEMGQVFAAGGFHCCPRRRHRSASDGPTHTNVDRADATSAECFRRRIRPCRE